jgi:type II secretory pathway pseudopilin PulG
MVVAWVGVLAAILVPNFIRARARGRLTACKSNLKNIGTALEMYSTDHAGRYPLRFRDLTPNYLKTIPTCPTAGIVTYLYAGAAHPDLYTVVCAGLHHAAQGITTPNYPQYTSITGLIERP